MIRLGLCSGAFLALGTTEIISIAKDAGLDAIEWAADAHIRPGDIRAAESVMMATLRADMTLSSYSSLYRAGSEDESLARFQALLDTASAMYAPNLRIFSPLKSTREKRATDDIPGTLRRLGDRAGARGITACLSLGRNTYLDNYASALDLIARTAHPFVRLAWEDLPDSSGEAATEALESSGEGAALLIVRCVDRGGRAIGIEGRDEEWKRRFASFKRSERDPKMGSFVLIGSAPNASALAEEARALRALVEEIEPPRRAS